MNQPISKLMPLTDVLALLPGVKPRSTRCLIDEWERRSWNIRMTKKGFESSPRNPLVIGSVTIAPEILSEMQYSDETQMGKAVVSPRAAMALIALHSAGMLPMQSKADTPETPSNELLTYAESGLSIKQVQANKDLEVNARSKAKEQLLKRPLESFLESEINEALLHDLFLHHKVANGSLRIGSITVIKTLTPSRSKSGKSQAWNEHFSWVDSDGISHQHSTDGAYAGNRRNDSSRNWGLGRG